MKWCCTSFQSTYERAGHRGLGIVVHEDSGVFSFRFQSRTVHIGKEKNVTSSDNVTFSLVSESGLQFCPWCGQSLKKFFKNEIEKLYRPGFGLSDKIQAVVKKDDQEW